MVKTQGEGKGFYFRDMKYSIVLSTLIFYLVSCDNQPEKTVNCGEEFHSSILPLKFQISENWDVAEYESDHSMIITYEAQHDGKSWRVSDDFEINVGIYKPRTMKDANAFVAATIDQASTKNYGLSVVNQNIEVQEINGSDWIIGLITVQQNDDESDPIQHQAFVLSSFGESGSIRIYGGQNNLNNKKLSIEIDCFIQSLILTPIKKQNR